MNREVLWEGVGMCDISAYGTFDGVFVTEVLWLIEGTEGTDDETESDDAERAR